MNCSKIKLAVIPKFLENIGEMSFGYKHNLKNNNFTLVDDYTIVGCPNSIATAYAVKMNLILFHYVRKKTIKKKYSNINVIYIIRLYIMKL